MTTTNETRHPLCYCSSLPGSKCDFCTGLRKGTLDDWREHMDTYLRETIKEVMVAYNKAREAWVLEYGNGDGFNDWFTKQVMGR